MSAPASVTSAREHLAFLIGSPERLQLLAELQDRSLSPTELGARTNVSDRTVQKLLEAGLERDWITQGEASEQYTLTVAGDLILQAYVDTETLDRGLLTYLTTSEPRLHVLEHLENEALSAVEINNRLSVADPTVYRALHSLEERGLVEWNQDATLTTAGADVFEAYRRLVDTIRWIMNHATVLDHLGEIGRTMPARALAQDSGEIVVNSMAHPDAVLDHIEARIEALSPARIRGVLPSMCAFVDRVRQPLLEADTDIEVVVDEAVLDVTRVSYPAVLDSVAEVESAELFVYPEKLRFGLAMLNDSVFILAYDNQSLRACIETASETLGGWATDVYQTHQQAAYRHND
jgi:predicted transcriptional regulator